MTHSTTLNPVPNIKPSSELSRWPPLHNYMWPSKNPAAAIVLHSDQNETRLPFWTSLDCKEINIMTWKFTTDYLWKMTLPLFQLFPKISPMFLVKIHSHELLITPGVPTVSEKYASVNFEFYLLSRLVLLYGPGTVHELFVVYM